LNQISVNAGAPDQPQGNRATDLLLSAAKQAEQSEPAVRAAAMMHIARVLACSDQAAAEQVLEHGIALTEGIEGAAPSLLLSNAVSLAAAVSAKHALPLHDKYGKIDPFPRSVVVLVDNLAQHGHVAEAIAYLRNPLPGDRFPLDFVNNLDRECREDETQRELLPQWTPKIRTIRGHRGPGQWAKGSLTAP